MYVKLFTIHGWRALRRRVGMEKTMEAYYVIQAPGHGEIVEKKSRFIAGAYPVTDSDGAAKVLEAVRKQYWDARHNCYAYVCGEGDACQKSSDDGEPSGTAGKPILEVIHSRGIHDCLIVVTRYFGGTLLGTGGLVRAYSQAAAAALDASVVKERVQGRLVRLTLGYGDYEQVRYIAAQLGTEVFDVEYADRISLKLQLDNGGYADFMERAAVFNGRIGIETEAASILR
jgi:uncharacterized YigZ family protein